MIYDRGFEIRLSNQFKMFFYNYYDTLDHSKRMKQEGSDGGGDGQSIQNMNFDYYSDCGQTLTGWFSIWNNKKNIM